MPSIFTLDQMPKNTRGRWERREAVISFAYANQVGYRKKGRKKRKEERNSDSLEDV